MRFSIVPLVKRLAVDFPGYTFRPGRTFSWSASTRTITYAGPSAAAPAYLLHEIAHARLGHAAYEFDIDLLRQEADAWEYAAGELAGRYAVKISQDFADDCLETYRKWLYERSLCPRCNQTGLQTQQKTYSCINCRSSWRANDARQCALRRRLV